VRLLVVSGTPHHRDGDGQTVGWGPSVRELEQLTTLFDEIVHVAPLNAGRPPATDCPYTSGRVRLRPVLAAGGEGILAKLGILRRVPSWVAAIRSELRHADAVHVRCPANVSLIALLVIMLIRRSLPRWVKYAGNWSPATNDAASYRLQRWMLRRNLCRAAVTINGSWPAQPAHVHSFVNPALTDEELWAAAQTAADKTLDGELRIAFAGRLEEPKGAGRVLEIADRLAASGVPFHIDLAGDGPNRRRYEAFVSARRLSRYVTFHGWLDRTALDGIYARAHILLLPSAAEGFPKVLAEGMAHGAIPVASDVSSIRQVLAEAKSGTVLPAADVEAFVAAISERADSERWRRESTAAVHAASRFTYSQYLVAVRSLFRCSWGIQLRERSAMPRGCDARVAAVARPTRIGVFGPHLGRNEGWVVSQGEILIRLLSEAGHDVYHASTKPQRLPRALDTVKAVLQVGGALDLAVIAVFSGPGFAMAEITTALAASRGVPVILVLHGGNLSSFATRHPRRARRLLTRARVVVAPSPFLARSLGHLRRDITVVPNALPLREYSTRTRGPLRPRLLWMRTLEPIYRPHLPLEVLRVLLRTHPSVILTLAGQDRGLLEKMKQRAAELGVTHAVRFPGFLDPQQKQRAFDDHDVFLSTSAVDNAPVSVLEAAMCGLVVVATNVGGLGDLLVHGEDGLLVPDGDVPAMASAVRTVLDDATLARVLSEGGQKLGARSTQENATTRWEEVIQRI
jgi:glycosyltransferase involved in cell wall biosynthesis